MDKDVDEYNDVQQNLINGLSQTVKIVAILSNVHYAMKAPPPQTPADPYFVYYTSENASVPWKTHPTQSISYLNIFSNV